MDAATLTADTFYIAEADVLGNEVAGTKVAGTVTYDAASFTATFAPSAALKEKQRYAAILTKSAKDAVGIPAVEQKVLFTTDDFTAPTVTSTSVDSGARVEYNGDITINFSEKMDAAQMVIVAYGAGQQVFTAGTSVRVYNQTDNFTIDGTAGPDYGGSGLDDTGLQLVTTYAADATNPRLVVKAPTAGWGINKVYQIVLNGHTVGETTMALSDALVAGTKTHGNMMAGDYTLTFTTVAESRPAVTNVKVMKTTDGAAATTPTYELSRAEMTYNVQNAGTAKANNKMTITFNKNMDATKFADGDLEFWYDDGNGGGTPNNGIFEAGEKVAIPATELTVSADKKTVTWEPTAGLARLKADEHEGRLVIKNTIKDESGQALGKTAADDVAYQFTTGAGPVYAAPTVTTGGIVAPVKYATGVKRNQVIEVKFDEAIKYATINNVEIRKAAVDGDLVAGTWYTDVAATTLPTGNVDTFFFKPAASLDSNTKYFVVVPATVTDARGNVATPYNYYFTTENVSVPTATITMPGSPTEPIVVNFDMQMATGTAGDDIDEASAYVVNGVSTGYVVVVDSAKKVAKLYLDAVPANNSVLTVTVKAGIAATNTQVTASAVTAEQLVSNPEAIAAFGVKEAKYDATSRMLVITLDRPGVFAGPANGSEIAITNGAYKYATNWVSASASSDGLTFTYVLKDTSPSTLSIAPGVSKVNIVAGKITYTDQVNGAGQNYGTTPVTITAN
jgi:hypothetical protein